jgi:hypothetical protein
VTISPVGLRTVITPPVFVSDRLPREAFTICAPPKIGSLGLGEPPPNTAMARPGGKIVPGAKR